MDLKTLAGLFTGISAVGSGVSGLSQYQKGKAEERAYRYNAEEALREAEKEREATRAEYKKLMGRQKALYGQAGVDITSGSPLLILEDTLAKGAMEEREITEAGVRKARLYRYYGKEAERAGRIGGASTFFTGLGRAGLGYAKSYMGKTQTAWKDLYDFQVI